MPEAYKMAVMRQVLVGDIKRHTELVEDELTTYAVMRTRATKWAVWRRSGKERKPNDMQVGTEGERKRTAEENMLKEAERQWEAWQSTAGTWNSTYRYGSDGQWAENRT